MQSVRIASSLGRSGLQDWLLQRLTAVILALYLIFWTFYFLTTPEVHYTEWQTLFSNEFMRFSSILVLLSLLIHAWIGIWTVTTDYVKILSLRLILQSLFGLGLLFCLAWGFKILWNI